MQKKKTHKLLCGFAAHVSLVCHSIPCSGYSLVCLKHWFDQSPLGLKLISPLCLHALHPPHPSSSSSFSTSPLSSSILLLICSILLLLLNFLLCPPHLLLLPILLPISSAVHTCPHLRLHPHVFL